MRKHWAYLLIGGLAFLPFAIFVWRLSPGRTGRESAYLGRTTGWWVAECREWDSEG
jgi:hypothetical protein